MPFIDMSEKTMPNEPIRILAYVVLDAQDRFSSSNA